MAIPSIHLTVTDSDSYQKNVSQSETSESKTETNESFHADGVDERDDNISHIDVRDSRDNKVAAEGWHKNVPKNVPEQVKVFVEGVVALGNRDATSLSGDYILVLREQRAERCRWSLSIHEYCGLNQVTLVATPGESGTLDWKFFFEGTSDGPAWSANATQIDGNLLCLDRQTTGVRSAGCKWPASVLLTSLGSGFTLGGSFKSDAVR